MSGKHLCQSRLSAAYISSNRYMHIILFYFRLFILFSPGLPFIGLSSHFIRPSSAFIGLHPSFIRTSFALPSSFPHPSSGLVPAFLHLSSPFTRPSFSLSTVLSLVFPTGLSPSFSIFTLSVIPFAPPVIPALVSVIPGSLPRHSRLSPPSFQFSSSSFPARPGIPCHPEPVLLVILSASEGSSPTDFSIIISKHTKI